MSELGIGKLTTARAGRDAVHVAVAPIKAPHRLFPGQHVTADGQLGKLGSGLRTVGVVDPFLTESVEEGSWFWVFLYPNTVTSLRHEWTHPDFPDNSPIEVNAEILKYIAQKKTKESQ